MDAPADEMKAQDLIMVFGVPPLMPLVKSKLTSEARPGALVFCHRFPLPDWKPVREGDGCLLYKIGVSEPEAAGKTERKLRDGSGMGRLASSVTYRPLGRQ